MYCQGAVLGVACELFFLIGIILDEGGDWQEASSLPLPNQKLYSLDWRNDSHCLVNAQNIEDFGKGLVQVHLLSLFPA